MTPLRFIVFAILLMCVWSDSIFAWQEGMGGLGLNSSREVQAEGIIITWSETNDELRGFSQKLGEWEVLKIDPQKLHPGQAIIPIVAANVAAVRIGDSVAAFSGEKGWWDVVDLAKGAGSELTAYPSVLPSLVKVEDNGHLYTFSSSKGEWTSPTDPELQPATLKFSINPKEVEDGREQFEAWLNQLPQHEARRISMMFGNGFPYGVPYLVTTTRKSTMKLVRQKVEEFWCARKPVAKEATPAPEPVPEPKLSSAEIEPQINKLRADLEQLELAVRAGSGQLGNPNVDQVQQEREVLNLVEQSFDLRQQLQELEAQRLRLKLQQVENNLAVRAKSRDAMVERRMEELRRPDSGNNVPPQKPDNRSTSRDNPMGSEPIDSRISDVRIENAASKIQWPQPVEIARQLRGFRESAISDMEAIRNPKLSVETWSQPLEKLIADGLLNPGTGEDAQRDGLVGAKDRAAQLQKHLSDVRRDWNYAWSAYQAQLELFQLDMNDRKQEETLAALEVKQRTDANRESPNAYSPGEIRESEIKHEKSKIAVQRAEQMLKLYADIETNEPELNPATLKGLDELADDKRVAAVTEKEPVQNLPQQVIRMAEQLRNFRDAAVRFRDERQPHDNLITQYSRPIDQLKSEGVISQDTTEEDLKTQIARSRPEFDRLTPLFENAARAWRQAWSAYQSQIKILELEVKEAEAIEAAAQQAHKHAQAKFQQGLVGAREIREAESNLKSASIRFAKAQEQFRMWQELEKHEPDVNPDWKPESSERNGKVSDPNEAKLQNGAGAGQEVTTLNERLEELRDEALRLRKEREADETLLTQCARPLEELKAEGIVSAQMTAEELEQKIKESRARFDTLSSDLQITMSKWRDMWSVYPRGLISMEDQIKEIEHRISTEQKVLEQAQARNKAGLGDPNDVTRSEVRLKYLTEELLPGFKRSVVETQKQIDELGPELNPDWKPESSGMNVPE